MIPRENQILKEFGKEVAWLLDCHTKNLKAISEPFTATQLPSEEEQRSTFFYAIDAAVHDHRARLKNAREDYEEHQKSPRACEGEIRELQGQLEAKNRVLGQFHLMVDVYDHGRDRESLKDTAKKMRAILNGESLWGSREVPDMDEDWEPPVVAKYDPEPTTDVADYGESEGFGECTASEELVAEYRTTAEARQMRLHAATIAQEVIGKRGTENHDTHSRRFFETAEKIAGWLNDGTT